MNEYKKLLSGLLSEYSGLSENKILNALEIPPSINMGDLSFPCFVLSKLMKKSPALIADELSKKMIPNRLFSKFVANGPYLNVFFNRYEALKSVFGKKISFDSTGKRILFEYPSPNTNKPLHLGHLRNILLGSSTASICEKAGNDVIRTNLYNDRGIHICKSMLAYMLWGDNKTPQEAGVKPDHFVGYWYVKFSKKAREDPLLEKKAHDLLIKWESGDREVVKLWNKMNSWAEDGFNQTFKRLKISFDKIYRESDIYDKGKQYIINGLKNGLFEYDEKKNIVVDLGELGVKVLLRSDGTSIYITQDIALAYSKKEDFNPDTQVFVVGDEQKLHFKQLFAVLRKLGFKEDLYHLSYGLISIPGGRMKSREGTVVDADNLLDEVFSLAKKQVMDRHDDISAEEINRRAEVLSQAAIRFYLLKYEPGTHFVYNTKESLSFEGDTGPYILYAVARIHSILVNITVNEEIDSIVDVNDAEWELILTLMNTRQVIIDASNNFKPHLVARHALITAQKFTSFYHSCPVIKADDNKRLLRVNICRSVKYHLELLLGLLGISTLEKM